MTEPTTSLPLLYAILPAVVVGVTSFVSGMYIFKAKSETRDTLRHESVDKELAHMQKDISRLETTKVDKDRFEIVRDDIAKLEVTKADRELVLMMQKQIDEIKDAVHDTRSDTTEILRRLSS